MLTQKGKTLVTGGSGLVGRYLQEIMPNAIYISSKDYDLTDLNSVHSMLKKHKPDTIVHLAAKVGGIMDNLQNPVNYIEENILMNSNILKKCHEFNTPKLIAVLSTCIYPDVAKEYPMTEDMLFDGPPTKSNFSYAFAKRCMAVHIDAYVSQYNKKWCYLIPCNLYGEYDKYEDHHSHYVSALIKKIHLATKTINLWGTGKPLRQFMYGGDLAKIIKHMLDNSIVENLNVAPKKALSILEIAKIGLKACKKEHLEIKFDTEKPDGQFRKDVDSSKLLSLLKNFNFTSLEEGIAKTYDQFSTRHN